MNKPSTAEQLRIIQQLDARITEQSIAIADMDVEYGLVMDKLKVSAVELLTAQTENAELLKRLEAESELNALARKELCTELEAAESKSCGEDNGHEDCIAHILKAELEAAEEKLKNMPCYREWMLDADGLSGTSCADEAYVHDPLCPVCKATMEDK